MKLKLTFLFTVTFLCSLAQDQPQSERRFDGLYFTASAGSQNVFGGSWVNDTDILAEQSKFVLDFGAGFRKQFLKNRLLGGIEIIYGFTNGSLSYHSPADQLSITYENKTQFGVGGTAGVTVGYKRNNLIFVYGNETTRKFDVTIVDAFGPYHQTDEQGMFKYGIGYERSIYRRWNVRATLGGIRVDFGDRVTNIEVDDKMDIMAGISFQL